VQKIYIDEIFDRDYMSLKNIKKMYDKTGEESELIILISIDNIMKCLKWRKS